MWCYYCILNQHSVGNLRLAGVVAGLGNNANYSKKIAGLCGVRCTRRLATRRIVSSNAKHEIGTLRQSVAGCALKSIILCVLAELAGEDPPNPMAPVTIARLRLRN